MHIVKAFSVTLLVYIACIIIVDVAGALLVTILPEPGGRRLNGGAGFGSTTLYYVVWIVAGCFAGAFYTTGSWEATKKCTLVQQYPVIVWGIALVLSVAVIVLLYTLGEMNVYVFARGENYYVPGHRNMTYAFFIFLLLVSGILSYTKKTTGASSTPTNTGNHRGMRVEK